MDDLLAISMDPRVGMVQGDQSLGKKQASPNSSGTMLLKLKILNRILIDILAFFHRQHIDGFIIFKI